MGLLDRHDIAAEKGLHEEVALVGSRFGIGAAQAAEVPGAEAGGVSGPGRKKLSGPVQGEGPAQRPPRWHLAVGGRRGGAAKGVWSLGSS